MTCFVIVIVADHIMRVTLGYDNHHPNSDVDGSSSDSILGIVYPNVVLRKKDLRDRI